MAELGKNIELLAPAGKWETMIEVLAAGADAVYLGGKRFNMRMLKADHNFTDEQLRSAVQYAHERDKRVYVTVNNLLYQQELEELRDYLGWLNEIDVDAVIVQDLAVAQITQTAIPDLPLHASVQMGIGNSAAAGCLEKGGFTRVVLSKNLAVDEIKAIHEACSLELEYFIHGDVCISHTGQCYLSSFIFGESGNRGRCKKPCRWVYRLQGREEHMAGYYLAHNDLCLLAQLPQLLDAGVVSLKIEGRMRGAEYLCGIITTYREAITAWEQASPLPPDIMDRLYPGRVRDFTTAGFSHRPTLDDIGVSGEREPAFPTAPIPVKPGLSVTMAPGQSAKLPVQVVVSHPQMINSLVKAGVSAIIISLPVNYARVSLAEWQEGLEQAKHMGAQLVYQFPRLVTESQLEQVQQHLENAGKLGINTILVSELGSMQLALNQGFDIWGDYSFNLTNGEAVAWLADQGVARVTASLELKQPQLSDLLTASRLPVDMLVHGRLPGIVTDFCLRMAAGEGCTRQEKVADLLMIDMENNQYPVDCDDNCRHSVYYPFELALLGHVTVLDSMGVGGIRLDLTNYEPEVADQVIKLYQQAMSGPSDIKALQTELNRVTDREFTDVTFRSANQETVHA